MIEVKIPIRKLYIILFTFPVLLLSNRAIASEPPSVPEDDQCIACHQELEIMPEGYQEYDIHLQKGLSCSGCHGGDNTSDDEDIAMSEENGFVGVPLREEIPQFCGKCHSNPEFMRDYHPGLPTDQVQQYYTSVHGIKFKKGDKKVATCINCHPIHSILPASDPRSSVYPLNVPQTCRHCHSNAVYMKDYKIPTNQYELYAKSVHGVALLENKDIGAPACNDCHGNHGATPPGLSSVTFVCGNCHVNNMNFFRQTRMAKAFEELGFHGCEQCHGNHAIEKTSDKFVGTNSESFCVKCHDAGEIGYETARTIKSELTELDSIYNVGNSDLLEVQRKGMNDIDMGFLLKDAHQRLIEARTLVHTFDEDTVKSKTDDGVKLVQQAITISDKEIDKYYKRRYGFLIATVVLIILAVAIFLKIKDIEKDQKKKEEIA